MYFIKFQVDADTYLMPLSSEIKELTEVGYKREPFLFSILILVLFVHCMTTPPITVLEMISLKHVGVPPCGDVCVNPPENPKRILPLPAFPPHLRIPFHTFYTFQTFFNFTETTQTCF